MHDTEDLSKALAGIHQLAAFLLSETLHPEKALDLALQRHAQRVEIEKITVQLLHCRKEERITCEIVLPARGAHQHEYVVFNPHESVAYGP